MSYCKVTQCRFAHSHCTRDHVCGTCLAKGHGEIECHHPGRRAFLLQFHNETLPPGKHCTVSDCISKEYHSADAHHCSICKIRTQHASAECPQAQQQIQNTNTNIMYHVSCPICRSDNTITNPKKILGLSDQCCICMSNNVEILFPNCYHVCVCLDCLKNL